MMAKGYVAMQKHPQADLYIYNYTAKAQYDNVWNEITLMCRGLILDGAQTIVARPFQKFFNYGEGAQQQIPNEHFEVFEKMDGSLGILYWLDDKPYIATRGSFNSEQAIKATAILNEKYAHVFDKLDQTITHLFEIIYPENRIVVNYGDTEDLVLTAMIDIATGKDVPLQNIGFTMVQKYDAITDFKTLQAKQQDNKEGYVIKFESGFRMKIKFEEYLRLHRIVTQISSINIWEFLSTGQSIDSIIDQVPDEFYNWVKATVSDLNIKYKEVENICNSEYKELIDRKETALYFLTCAYPSVLFNMYSKKKYDSIIWKLIRPKFDKPFKNTENDN
jgi:T4 RnlA family RNA ligase